MATSQSIFLPPDTDVVVIQFVIDGKLKPEDVDAGYELLYDRGDETPDQVTDRLMMDEGTTIFNKLAWRGYFFQGRNLRMSCAKQGLSLTGIKRQERTKEQNNATIPYRVITCTYRRHVPRRIDPAFVVGESYIDVQLRERWWSSLGIYSRKSINSKGRSVLFNFAARLTPERVPANGKITQLDAGLQAMAGASAERFKHMRGNPRFCGHMRKTS